MRNKSNDSLDRARRIRAAGCPIYIAEDDGETNCIPSDGLSVYHVGGPLESSAFEYCGGPGMMIRLVITVLVPTFVIASFDVELPWQKMGFRWLDDPREIDESLTHYSFSGRHYECDRKDVLNHRADVTRTLRRGQSIEGSLPGNDTAPIPDEVRDASLFPAIVIIGDQYGRRYRAPVQLSAMQGGKYVRHPSRRGGLFEKRDPIPVERVRFPRNLVEQPATLVDKSSTAIRSPLADKDITQALEEPKRNKQPREVPVLS